MAKTLAAQGQKGQHYGQYELRIFYARHRSTRADLTDTFKIVRGP